MEYHWPKIWGNCVNYLLVYCCNDLMAPISVLSKIEISSSLTFWLVVFSSGVLSFPSSPWCPPCVCVACCSIPCCTVTAPITGLSAQTRTAGSGLAVTWLRPLRPSPSLRQHLMVSTVVTSCVFFSLPWAFACVRNQLACCLCLFASADLFLAFSEKHVGVDPAQTNAIP